MDTHASNAHHIKELNKVTPLVPLMNVLLTHMWLLLEHVNIAHQELNLILMEQAATKFGLLNQLSPSLLKYVTTIKLELTMDTVVWPAQQILFQIHNKSIALLLLQPHKYATVPKLDQLMDFVSIAQLELNQIQADQVAFVQSLQSSVVIDNLDQLMDTPVLTAHHTQELKISLKNVMLTLVHQMILSNHQVFVQDAHQAHIQTQSEDHALELIQHQ